MKKQRKARTRKKFDPTIILDSAIIFIGCVIYAISIDVFTSPNDIAPGGIIGISTMVHYLVPLLPIGAMTFVVNIPIFIWGGVDLGWKYMGRSLVTTALSSVIIDVLTIDFFRSILPAYTGDKVLAAVFGGVLSGVGLSLIFYRGSSTGGTDIVSRILHKKMPHLSVGNIMLVFDFVVVVIAAVVYQNIENALYALISIFVYTKVIDAVLYGVARDNGKLLFIVTKKYNEVTQEIIKKVDRGVTLLDAEGGFSGDNKKVVMCAVRPQQVHKTNRVVMSIDPEAFIITATAGSIRGKGFPSIDEEDKLASAGDSASEDNTDVANGK